MNLAKLKNNSREKMIQLKLEQDILQFINDNRNLFKRFPQTTSYYNAITTGSYLFGDEQKC